MEEFGQQPRSALEWMAKLWELLPRLDTGLGELTRLSLSSRVSPDDHSPKERGTDLLPLNPQAIDSWTKLPDDLKASLKLLVTTLNYLSMGGRIHPKANLQVPKELTLGQDKMLDHLSERLIDLGRESKICNRLELGKNILNTARFSYTGEPIHPMEDLIAEKIIPVWPAIGECAVQDVMPYLPPQLAEMIADPRSCLKPEHEWPDRPVKSRVRASQEEWDKIVHAAHLRGLMVPLEGDQVFRDSRGEMVLNGAGGVRKMKKIGGEEVAMQRFISNLIPSNDYQLHINDGDRFLPYLGQLTLLEQSPEESYLIDSEDFTSCFNLFRLPSAWWPLMCFEKQVDGRVFGRTPGVKYYAAMAVVPMGWVNAVSVIQSVVRSLVFEGADIPEDSEITKMKQMPNTDDYTVIYLDSFDELRRLNKQCAEALEGQASARHLRFRELCHQKGLPLNDGKRLVGAVQGTLQGGTLDGDLGWYKLSGDKQVDLTEIGISLLSLPRWEEFQIRHFIGKATFGMCFRRPLLSIFQDIFPDLQRALMKGSCTPSSSTVDEVIMTISSICLMGSCL